MLHAYFSHEGVNVQSAYNKLFFRVCSAQTQKTPIHALNKPLILGLQEFASGRVVLHFLSLQHGRLN